MAGWIKDRKKASRRSQAALLIQLPGFCKSEMRKPGKPYPFDTFVVRMDISHPISTEPFNVCQEDPTQNGNGGNSNWTMPELS